MLGLLPRSLLVRHLLLSNLGLLEVLGSRVCLIRIISAGATLVSAHVEDRGCLARIIDDDVVYVIVVYDVRDVWTSSTALLLSGVLLGRWRRTSTAHPKALAVGVPLALQPTIIFALFGHRVLCELLVCAAERTLLAITIVLDEIIALFRVLLRLLLLLLLSLVRAEDAAFAISHIRLPCQTPLRLLLLLLHSRLILEIAL